MSGRDCECVLEAMPDPEQSIAACFDDVAERHRDMEAIGSGTWRPTYGELRRAADWLALKIVGRGGGLGDRVVLLMRHDGPLVAGILAVVKAGRVAVVLNPTDPRARQEQVVEDCEPSLIVADGAHGTIAAELAAGAGGCGVCVVEDSEAAALGGEPAGELPGGDVSADAVAFLIYTSGTTGRPKGVMQTHRNIIHNARRNARGLGVVSRDRILLVASPSGGQGVGTLFFTLLRGATVCLFAAMEKGVTGLAEMMTRERVTVYVSAASLFRHYMSTLSPETRFEAVRMVRLASERATYDDVARYRGHFPQDAVWLHTLGSTETGNITAHRIVEGDGEGEGVLPAGLALEGMEVLILDASGAEAPAGTVGRLVVRSRYLSPGYWRNAALTGERFEACGSDGLVRRYTSGDLAMRGSDGLLRHMGRADSQVKINGFRVEVGEIEMALCRQPGVVRAAVVGRVGERGGTELAAYVVAGSPAPLNIELLRSGVRKELPWHMVPAVIVQVEKFPLTAGGKIDFEGLRGMRGTDARDVAVGEPPATPTEIVVAKYWGQVFGRAAVSRTEDFFDLGGDSLMAAVISARLYSELGVRLDLRAFAEHPVLSAFAAAIDAMPERGRGAAGVAIERVSRDRLLPLSYSQERTWGYSQTAAGCAAYTMACAHGLFGALDVEALRASLEEIVRRHEILRTTFEVADGEVVQVIRPLVALELPVIDLSGMGDAEGRAEDLFRTEAGRPFDLGKGPLLRFVLLKIGPEEHRLLRVYHHILADAWSWKLFFRELQALYEAGCRGERAALPEVARLQFADYAVWQREMLRPASAAYREEVAWWERQLTPAAPELRLPFQRLIRRRGARPADGWIWWGIKPEVTAKLEVIARRHGVTYYMLRLAAFVSLLARKTGRREVVLGTYVTNRNQVETQGMIGFFTNLSTFRIRYEASEGLGEWLRRVRDAVGQVQSRSQIPYEMLSEELKKGGVRVPPIRAIFSMSEHAADLRMGEVELTWRERRLETMPWGFTLNLDQRHEDHRCYAAFDARVYDPKRVRQFVEAYAGSLEEIANRGS